MVSCDICEFLTSILAFAATGPTVHDGSNVGSECRIDQRNCWRCSFAPYHELFMIGALKIDIPDIMIPTKDVSCRERTGQHGVVLIVVAMHAIPAHRLKIFKSDHPSFDGLDCLLIGSIVNRIGFRLPDYTPIDDFGAVTKPQCFELACGKLD